MGIVLTQRFASHFSSAASIIGRAANRDDLSPVHWYCIHTRPAKEMQVADYCSNTLGLETYYPRLRRQRTIRRKRQLVVQPLFPRYLFCRFDLAGKYRTVRYAPEVIDLVHIGDKPAIVSDTVISTVRDWAGSEVDIISAPPEFRAGDSVEIADGPLRGLSAVVLRDADDRDRIAILLSMLHDAQLTISRSQLRRLD